MPLINMGDVEEFEALPKGKYSATLTEREFVENESDDDEKYGYEKLTFTVDEGEYEGRKLFRNLSHSPKSLVYLKKALIALGADEEAVSGEFDTDEIFPELVGNSVDLMVDVRDYEGEQQNDVKRILPQRVAV